MSKYECNACRGIGKRNKYEKDDKGNTLAISIECPICAGTGEVEIQTGSENRPIGFIMISFYQSFFALIYTLTSFPLLLAPNMTSVYTGVYVKTTIEDDFIIIVIALFLLIVGAFMFLCTYYLYNYRKWAYIGTICNLALNGIVFGFPFELLIVYYLIWFTIVWYLLIEKKEIPI